MIVADSKKVAFVPPRYGDDVVGGSEAVMREAAQGLARRGWEVEVLTTCARDHYTWTNDYPEGSFEVDGLVLRRFPTVHDSDPYRPPPPRLVSAERRILLGLPVTADEEAIWVNGYFRAPGLFHHLVARAPDYRAVIVSPYLVWTTTAGWSAAPERTVVMPCLHDEPYARLGVVRRLLAGAAQVWFLSEPEHELGHRLGPLAAEHRVVGCGVPIPMGYDPAGFRARHGLAERPFALYAGRREWGKGWDDLLAVYVDGVNRGLDLDLVSVGVGAINPPPETQGRLVDLGFLTDAEMSDAFAAATVYVQPSPNESFSRTVMEAWLAGTPVVANAASPVVAWHCRRWGAGLVYAGDAELAECLALVAERPEALAGLGRGGRQYVLANYTWETVLDRMEEALGVLR